MVDLLFAKYVVNLGKLSQRYFGRSLSFHPSDCRHSYAVHALLLAAKYQ